ncbi:hypothetical protein U1Q18_011438 [Sarracenia purpurea var. burkii]
MEVILVLLLLLEVSVVLHSWACGPFCMELLGEALDFEFWFFVVFENSIQLEQLVFAAHLVLIFAAHFWRTQSSCGRTWSCNGRTWNSVQLWPLIFAAYLVFDAQLVLFIWV